MENIKIENLPGEMWKPVVEYEEYYDCSNYGRIKSKHFRKEHLMKAKHDKDGYLNIGLYKDGKQKFFQVHRIIGMAFIPNPFGLPCINHKNEIKDDNRVSNLEWCSVKYNNEYGTRTERAKKTRQKPVQCIDTGVIYDCAKSAGQEYNIKAECIRKNCRGIRKSAGKLHWCYVEKDTTIENN